MAMETRNDATGTASRLRITPITPEFAARAEAIDLSRPLDTAQIDGITAAMDRYGVLVFSGQELDDAQQLAFGSQFGPIEDTPTLVDQERRRLQTARINLGFTRVPAPITGRIGRSLFTQGALVTVNQVDPLAVIQRLDPVFVDIQQSSADLLSLRRALARNGIIPARAVVRLQLEDGSNFGQTGQVEFAEATVNQSTGTVTLRARFANPQGVLLPGMFVRASFAQAVNTEAFLVPQQAVSRDPKGGATLFVVGPNNRAVQREVTAERTQGPNWVVTQGLRPGDRVITQGTANLKPNAQIRPMPANAPQRLVPPKQGGGGGAAGGSGNGGGSQGQGGQGKSG